MRDNLFQASNINHPPTEHGATMIEYVLIVCCLLLVAVSSVSMVGAETRDTFDTIRYKLAHNSIPSSSSSTPPPPPPP